MRNQPRSRAWMLSLLLTAAPVALNSCHRSHEPDLGPSASKKVSPTKDGVAGMSDCRTWKPGPAIRPADRMLDWIAQQQNASNARRRRSCVPVVVLFEDNHRLAVGRSFIGAPPESPADVSLVLDDGALGVPLLQRLRRLCVPSQGACLVWVEGYWGPTVDAPSRRRSEDHGLVFSVRDVLGTNEPPIPAPTHILLEDP